MFEPLREQRTGLCQRLDADQQGDIIEIQVISKTQFALKQNQTADEFI
jgi:hypothetical protein